LEVEPLNVLIVGAGLSGIDAAYYLQKRCPSKSFLILEARDSIGGTWDLFRYPGVRSDSDMYTLGYTFRPWHEAKAIAGGPAILDYIRQTAQTYGIDRNIQFGQCVQRASWSSAEKQWTVEAICGPDQETVQYTCNFLYLCSGYYDYEHGHAPTWPGMERFTGRLVHPQHWPEDLDYTGRRVIVIGSGATAVTLVPAMTEDAAHITMLQRSPTYIASLPSEDRQVTWMNRHLPAGLAARLARWKSILLNMFLFSVARRWPESTRKTLLKQIRELLGPDYPVETHFAPTYNPWDQRLCLAPDGDLFTAIQTGKVSVVTGQIETFTEGGIRLQSGEELPADIIVTATGLTIKLMGGMEVLVDGHPVKLSQTLVYKGVMCSNIPNLAFTFGYTNASWTLKAELIAGYVCRLLNYMDWHHYQQVIPSLPEFPAQTQPALDFSSGYIQRAIDRMPRQGSKYPWRMYQNYLLDLLSLRYDRINDGVLNFEE
jgi:monooxygenase